MSELDPHHRAQIAYYRGPDHEAIRPVDSPYVRRHLGESLRELALGPGARLLEVGAGAGRFTRLLAGEGFRVLANDLSPDLLAALARDLEGRLDGILPGPMEGLGGQLEQPVQGAVGYFMLHHLEDLDRAFAGLFGALAPGAPAVFCEPNGLNPLFYLQLALTPHMTWKGDGGIRHMRAGVVLGAMGRAGFVETRCRAYGLFPPFLVNRPWGRKLEAALEPLPMPFPCRAFLVFSGRRPGA